MPLRPTAVTLTTRPSAPPAALLRDDTDARRYTRTTLACVSLLYATLGLEFANAMPRALIPVLVPLVYVRMALALHELMHVSPAGMVPRFHRLTMIFESPLCLGYREHRALHFAHHRFAGTDRDPERYQIVGGPWRAFLNATLSPERGFLRWVRAHGVSRTLAVEGAIRSIAFVTLLAINPPVFLLYWVCLRLSVGFASFMFHYVLHTENEPVAARRLLTSPLALRISGALVGREPILILTEHEQHHEWPGVRATNLPMMRAGR